MPRCCVIALAVPASALMLVAAPLPVSASAQAVSIALVPVGNPGNAGQLSGAGTGFGGYGPDAIVGGVNYDYAMGKYDVTAGQYCAFLNAVAAADPYALYCPDVDTNNDSYGCNIKQSGVSGSYTYSVASDWADRPVNFVSWGDAARFVNWLQNGQPVGTLTGNPSLDGRLTEDGTYDLDGATTYDALMAVTRNPSARWWLPTENEWYKAAYYDPQKPGGPGYWNFATGTNGFPSNVLTTPDPGNNANYYDTIGGPYWRTPVGAFTNSKSPYGTFDQDGNVWQWNETAVTSTSFGLRGGSFADGSVNVLAAAYRSYGGTPTLESSNIGFRVDRALLPGDADLDGTVDINDLSIVLTNYNMTGMTWTQGEFIGDGTVDINDLTIVLANYNQSAGSSAAGVAAVAEPSTTAIALSPAACLLAFTWARGMWRKIAASNRAARTRRLLS